MSQQQNLFPKETPVSPQPPDQRPGGSAPRQVPGRVPLWLQYLELSVRVVVRLYLGLILIVLPWTHFWSDNHLLLLVPHLSFIALNGATRGIISGLGLLNIWIAVLDAVHFKQG